MVPATFKVDIFSELDRVLQTKYELLVPEPVLRELENIKDRGTPKEKAAARVALDLVSKRAKIIGAKGKTDDAIAMLAEKWRALVATNDSKLRRKLRRRGVPVIFLRERSHLIVNGAWG
jgi:hypothetical protein